MVLLLQDRLLARQEERLKPDAERYDTVQQRLTATVAAMDVLKIRNRSNASAMADVRSRSALLGEITLILPSEMALRFQVEGSRLLIEEPPSAKWITHRIRSALVKVQGSTFNSTANPDGFSSVMFFKRPIFVLMLLWPRGPAWIFGHRVWQHVRSLRCSCHD